MVLPDLNINLKHSQGGTTFVVGIDTNGDLRLLYSDTLVHTSLILMSNRQIGRLSNRIEGRIWQQEKIIAVWNDVASSDMEIIEHLFKEIANIDISDYTFVSEFDNNKIFVMPIDTYEKLNVSNNWGDNDWLKILSAKKKEEESSQAQYSVKNKLGYDDKNYMRHFLYSENKKRIN